jgi:hypothetical protein
MGERSNFSRIIDTPNGPIHAIRSKEMDEILFQQGEIGIKYELYKPFRSSVKKQPLNARVNIDYFSPHISAKDKSTNLANIEYPGDDNPSEVFIRYGDPETIRLNDQMQREQTRRVHAAAVFSCGPFTRPGIGLDFSDPELIKLKNGDFFAPILGEIKIGQEFFIPEDQPEYSVLVNQSDQMTEIIRTCQRCEGKWKLAFSAIDIPTLQALMISDNWYEAIQQFPTTFQIEEGLRECIAPQRQSPPEPPRFRSGFTLSQPSPPPTRRRRTERPNPTPMPPLIFCERLPSLEPSGQNNDSTKGDQSQVDVPTVEPPKITAQEIQDALGQTKFDIKYVPKSHPNIEE